jgi:hypothetical protein
MAHADPSQCSTSVAFPLKELPTAQQSDADTHVTPSSTLASAGGLGELTIAHKDPSQCSIRV